MRLRRRADKRCGSDVALASKHHRVTNRRFTRIHQSSLTPHHHHRKHLQLKRTQYRRASIDYSRAHPSPFIPITERKASREPSPLTMVELRSSSDEISTNPNQTKSVKLKGRRKPNPKTELGNQKSARQSKERLYPSGSRPTTAELTKPPPLGDRNRRRQSWRNLCLLETKPSSRTMSFTALSSTRPRLYARDRSAMCGLVPELKQNGGERKRERSENQQLYK
ncbi:hypothetical protein HID58_058062 [Brassica napus]|uniref:Uncharacterized protein n=2 Tax=Brassica napus TaxID=3708 RepID=A0ABQ7ZP73_BRANA|nr:hypothetical protein HID58_058062 [Brassica napus]